MKRAKKKVAKVWKIWPWNGYVNRLLIKRAKWGWGRVLNHFFMCIEPKARCAWKNGWNALAPPFCPFTIKSLKIFTFQAKTIYEHFRVPVLYNAYTRDMNVNKNCEPHTNTPTHRDARSSTQPNASLRYRSADGNRWTSCKISIPRCARGLHFSVFGL